MQTRISDRTFKDVAWESSERALVCMELLPTYIDRGDGEFIPMEFTNSLFERTSDDIYDHIQSELEAKRNEHAKLLGLRTTLRQKLHAYETAVSGLRESLVLAQQEPVMKDLCAVITNVLATIESNNNIDTLRVNLHDMVVQQARYIRMRIHMLEEVLEDMKEQVGSIDGRYARSSDSLMVGMCPICYEEAIGHCLDPCGHCLCGACLEKDRGRSECFMCRSAVSQVIKIYL
jgi:hypothetical protein